MAIDAAIDRASRMMSADGIPPIVELSPAITFHLLDSGLATWDDPEIRADPYDDRPLCGLAVDLVGLTRTHHVGALSLDPAIRMQVADKVAEREETPYPPSATASPTKRSQRSRSRSSGSSEAPGADRGIGR